MTMKHVDIAIVGAGAAGLSAAARAVTRYQKKQIVLVEKADRVGKKLLVTGNGRCNLSNIHADENAYHGAGSRALIRSLFERYGIEEVLAFFRSLGLITRTDDAGRVYPLSNQASSVLDVLRLFLRNAGVKEQCGFEVKEIKREKTGFVLVGVDESICCEKLILSVGGRFDYAGRKTDSRSLFSSLGLKTTPCTASLSPVLVSSPVIKMLKGVRTAAAATLIKNGERIKTERGEVQFTGEALSGICIFNLSREANRDDGCEIALDLLPDYSFKEIKALLLQRLDAVDSADELFVGMFQKVVGLALLKTAAIPPKTPTNALDEKAISSLAALVKDWRFKTKAKTDLKNAQVTAGGVSLDQIDQKTFASRNDPALFVIGEALDIDGDCGGFNLQFAFSSGLCAGDSV